jgi:hypothetical protein
MKRTEFGLLIVSEVVYEVTIADILTAIKLSHDTTLSDKERDFVQEIADIPFGDDEAKDAS